MSELKLRYQKTVVQWKVLSEGSDVLGVYSQPEFETLVKEGKFVGSKVLKVTTDVMVVA